MIIDRVRIRRALCALALTLFLWFGGMAALALVLEPNGVVAFGRAPNLVRAAVSADALMVRAGPGYVILSRQRSGLVRELYAGGAWFVWPIVARGCGGPVR